MQFQWSKKKYTLKDLITLRKDKLPMIVNVAEGYCGSDGDDTHDIAAGSVFFVYAVEVQSRVVALTEDERYLSMAMSCPVNFQVILNDQSLSKPYRLNDIVMREHNNLGDLRIQMAAPEAGGLGPMDAGSSDIQGTLRVLDLYDERYLLCHAFVEGEFCVTGAVSVPSYLPLTVMPASGTKHGSRADFKAFLDQVNASAMQFQQEYLKQPRNAEEIVVFSDPPNGDYEYIKTTADVTRIPSFKIVDTTRNPETEVTQSRNPCTETTETRLDAFLTVPRLPPRNLPQVNPPEERPKLEEKVLESRAAWTTSYRRPLPPVPDQTESGSPRIDECWSDKQTTVDRKLKEAKSGFSKKLIRPLKKELFHKGESHKSTWQSPIFPSKFRSIRSELDDVVSDAETPQRGRSTGNVWRRKASCDDSATSDQKPHVQTHNPQVTWSSLKRSSDKRRPPVPKKPSVQGVTGTRKLLLTSRSCTETLTELDGSSVDASKSSCLQRPGTLTLGQLDSSGYEGDFESYYDEIKSPMTGNRLSGVEDKADVTSEQENGSLFVPSGETMPLSFTDAGHQSGGKSDSETEDPDSSYEEISLPSSRTSETASDSGVSSAATNASTPTPHSGVHNFINARRDIHSLPDDHPDAWPDLKDRLQGHVRPPMLTSTKQRWRSADDVPLDIASLSVGQVSWCLVVLNLDQYVRTFREQQIDGALLSCLDKDVLVSDFGFRKFDAIKLAKFARDGWRPKVDQGDTHC